MGDTTAVDSDEIAKIAAKEKDQGRRAERKAVLKSVGFNSLRELQDFVEKSQKGASMELQEQEKALKERDTELARREAELAAKEQVIEVKAALQDAGIGPDNLEDASILIRSYGTETPVKDRVETLKGRHPGWFTPAGIPDSQLPAGAKRAPSEAPGATGRAEAAKRFGTKTD